jgi:hypothetical protein
VFRELLFSLSGRRAGRSEEFVEIASGQHAALHDNGLDAGEMSDIQKRVRVQKHEVCPFSAADGAFPLEGATKRRGVSGCALQHVGSWKLEVGS